MWYQTDLEAQDPSAQDGSEAQAPNATLEDGHENPWLDDETIIQTLGGDRRMVSYDGWRLWAKDVPAQSATYLDVADLNLTDGERVTGVRFEYGCIDAGFGTGSTSWDRPGLKDEDDACDHDRDGAPRSKGAIFHMRAAAPAEEVVRLENTATVDLVRNGGGNGLVAHDDDRVAQEIPPAPKDRPASIPQTSGGALVPTLLVFSTAVAFMAHIARRTSAWR
ncbi:Cna B domain protein, partial [gut metagenome]